MSHTRDIESAYRDARVQAYLTYRNAGQKDRSEHMARVLREVHGFDVADLDQPGAKPEPESSMAGDEAKEHAAAEPPPEATVEPRPARTPRKPRPAGK